MNGTTRALTAVEDHRHMWRPTSFSKKKKKSSNVKTKRCPPLPKLGWLPAGGEFKSFSIGQAMARATKTVAWTNNGHGVNERVVQRPAQDTRQTGCISHPLSKSLSRPCLPKPHGVLVENVLESEEEGGRQNTLADFGTDACQDGLELRAFPRVAGAARGLTLVQPSVALLFDDPPDRGGHALLALFTCDVGL